MIITCPDCFTRYNVDAKTLGQSGREVRCASCSHKWFVTQETGQDEIDPSSIETETKEDAEKLPDDVVSKEDNQANEDLDDDAQDVMVEDNKVNDVVDPEPEQSIVADKEKETTKPPHRAYRDKLEAKAKRKSKIIASGAWLGVAASLILIASMAILNRNTVVRVLPKTAGLFASIGMPANQWGVVLKAKQATREYINGEDVLRITGEIYNPGKKMRITPLIRISMRDETGEEIHTWTTPASLAELPPDTSAHFTTEVRNVPTQAVDIEFSLIAVSSQTENKQIQQSLASGEHH